MSAERALAAGVRAAVMANAGVCSVLGDPARFYDDPPIDPVFPYVTLGRVEARASDTPGASALEHVTTIHVWSRYGGRAEALDIIGALRAALHDVSLPIEGRRLIFLFVSFTDVFRSGDGRTTHGVMRLRAITEPN